ncbi:helix-turn-helix domain-containing protein [Nocardia sp. CDC186]|uniref:Helix-turn-helix domain-containing protein n=1 Tax=Nocardia implantans TaxID=3108168 RepID=A0ABU6ASM8_9NOCA|nr:MULTISPECIES: helix-turn-helix domain-containing protein [unclassified Nocardia]MBF6191795.1 helix-turn-helix domain-containing protein [Nocardia beijingensis]MEA3527892.1 helix-turn-helix domain-containing protein [Nocardia sp. CDC192]MEB3510356.1 helix-turn-helix domain-containing protein [Nocardia sp. CDC186]
MSADVDSTIRDVAGRVKADLDRLTSGMTAMFAEVIPEFRHDDEVRRLMIASTASNLTAILDMLMLSISRDDITVPPAAAEYARRFAQHGMSLEALLRAYRLGEHMFMQQTIAVLRQAGTPADLALATTSRVAVLVNSYIDQVIEGLIDIYESERRRWDARSDTTRAAQIRAVLDTDDLDVASAEEMLSASLRGWHMAAVVWVREPGASSIELLRAGTSMLAAATGKHPLTVLVDEQNCWAWISSAGEPALDADRLERDLRRRPGISVAVGDPGPGLAGFRQTFRDAQRARSLALLAEPARPLTVHARVALASLLVDHLPDTEAWVRRVLGDLMREDETTARLRETVQTYLEARGSLTDAAARMHVHKNTVHYRIRRAEEVLGHPLTVNRLETEVALMVAEQLGLGRVQ